MTLLRVEDVNLLREIFPQSFRVIMGDNNYNSGRKSCWSLCCIKGFSSNELFEISHDGVTENARLRQNFW